MNIVAKESMDRRNDKLFNFRPALFAAIFLGAGVVAGYYFLVREASALWLLALLPVPILTLLFSKNVENGLWRSVVLILLFCCFVIGFNLFRDQLKAFVDCPPYTGEVMVSGTVENRLIDEDYYRVTLRDVFIDGEEVDGRLNAYLPRSFIEDIKIADKIFLRGDIRTDLSPTGDYGLRSSAIGKKLRYTLTTDECVKIGRTDNLFLRIRSRVEKVVYAGMDDTSAALSLALLTGDCSGIEEGLSDNMRYGGISHVFAVSGLNVSALFAACLFAFGKTPLRKSPKWARFCLVVGILFLYAGVCGFTASVVRAAVMCAVCYAVSLMGFGADMLNALGASGIIILFFNPIELLSVGFQLSFLACFGLFLFAKPIGQVFDELPKAFRKRFPRRYSVEERKMLDKGDTLPPTIGETACRWTVNILAATVAAQITTLPALMIWFDFVSGWSLLLNFLIVPIIDAGFVLLLAFVGVCCVLPFSLSGVLLYLPSALWSLLALVFEAFDFSNFALTNVQMSAGFCVCYYGGIIFLTDKLNLPKTLRRWLAVSFFLVGALLLLLSNV